MDHQALDQSTSLPLQGRTVLVTRAVDQSEEFSRLLRERGGEVLFFPTIRIVPPDSWAECDRAIEALKEYDGLLFTSANAVKFFFERLGTGGTRRKLLREKPMYTVGPATAGAILREGMHPTLLPGVSSARELALKLLEQEPRGRRFLFVRGNLSGNDLPGPLRAKLIRVDEVTVYKTVPPGQSDAGEIQAKLENGAIDCLAFFSPSSVRNFTALIPAELALRAKVSAIGSSTVAAVREAGLPVHIVPSEPTAAEMAEAIGRYFMK